MAWEILPRWSSFAILEYAHVGFVTMAWNMTSNRRHGLAKDDIWAVDFTKVCVVISCQRQLINKTITKGSGTMSLWAKEFTEGTTSGMILKDECHDERDELCKKNYSSFRIICYDTRIEPK